MFNWSWLDEENYLYRGLFYARSVLRPYLDDYPGYVPIWIVVQGEIQNLIGPSLFIARLISAGMAVLAVSILSLSAYKYAGPLASLVTLGLLVLPPLSREFLPTGAPYAFVWLELAIVMSILIERRRSGQLSAWRIITAGFLLGVMILTREQNAALALALATLLLMSEGKKAVMLLAGGGIFGFISIAAFFPGIGLHILPLANFLPSSLLGPEIDILSHVRLNGILLPTRTPTEMLPQVVKSLATAYGPQFVTVATLLIFFVARPKGPWSRLAIPLLISALVGFIVIIALSIKINLGYAYLYYIYQYPLVALALGVALAEATIFFRRVTTLAMLLGLVVSLLYLYPTFNESKLRPRGSTLNFAQMTQVRSAELARLTEGARFVFALGYGVTGLLFEAGIPAWVPPLTGVFSARASTDEPSLRKLSYWNEDMAVATLQDRADFAVIRFLDEVAPYMPGLAPRIKGVLDRNFVLVGETDSQWRVYRRRSADIR